MKNFKLMMMAGMMAFATAASAQKTCFVATDIEFAGEATQTDLVISMDYDAEEGTSVCCWQFELYLPDGIEPIYDADEEEWLGEVSTETNTKRLAKGGLNITKKADGGYLVLGFDTKGNQPMVSTKGELCTITLSGSASIKDEGRIVNSAISDQDNNSIDKGNLADFIFNINGGPVGINDIKAADATAPAYNLQGIRVNNAKGLIIRDGKKMIVK